MAEPKHTLPDVAPHHWTTSEGKEMAERYAAMGREHLAMADRPDLGLANAIFLIDRNSLDLLALQTAAKERIRWLSVQLFLADRDAAQHADILDGFYDSTWELASALSAIPSHPPGRVKDALDAARKIALAEHGRRAAIAEAAGTAP